MASNKIFCLLIGGEVQYLSLLYLFLIYLDLVLDLDLVFFNTKSKTF